MGRVLAVLLAASGASDQAKLQALVDGIDLRQCTQRPEWGVRGYWITATQLPGGAVHFAVLPDRSWGPDVKALQECFESKLPFGSGTIEDNRPKKPLFASRRVMTPEPPSGAALRAVLDAKRAELAACALASRQDRTERSVTLAVRVQVNRATTVEPLSDFEPSALQQCVINAVPAGLPPAAIEFRLELKRDEAAKGLPKHDGTAGAICNWGQRMSNQLPTTQFLPEPAPCKAGLTCCYGGGIAGQPSSCMNVNGRGCPMYP